MVGEVAARPGDWVEAEGGHLWAMNCLNCERICWNFGGLMGAVAAALTALAMVAAVGRTLWAAAVVGHPLIYWVDRVDRALND